MTVVEYSPSFKQFSPSIQDSRATKTLADIIGFFDGTLRRLPPALISDSASNQVMKSTSKKTDETTISFGWFRLIISAATIAIVGLIGLIYWDMRGDIQSIAGDAKMIAAKIEDNQKELTANITKTREDLTVSIDNVRLEISEVKKEQAVTNTKLDALTAVTTTKFDELIAEMKQAKNP